MSLTVYSAHIGYRGADRLDITRKSAGPEGLPFAPSWKILGPALESRKRMDELRSERLYVQAAEFGIAWWREYRTLFVAEMRESYRANRPAWDALLARETATLVCYCPEYEVAAGRCHRVVLRAEILPRLGARDGGERGAS